MPYQITHFDNVPLMRGNPQQDHSPAGTMGALRDSVGGYYDLYGARKARARIEPISLTGVYWGEPEYLVDEDGNLLDDENGDYLIAGDGPTMLRSQIHALAEKVRERGQLWREHVELDGVRQWKTARLMEMPTPQVVKDRMFKAAVTCRFETAMEYWHAEAQTIFSVPVTAAPDIIVTTEGLAYLLVENPGMPVNDAVITVTCTSGTITAFYIRCVELGISWIWTQLSPGIAISEMLVIDCGDNEVPDEATNAFAGYQGPDGAHSARGWFPIATGTWSFETQVVGGNAVVELSFYVQYP